MSHFHVPLVVLLCEERKLQERQIIYLKTELTRSTCRVHTSSIEGEGVSEKLGMFYAEHGLDLSKM